jgi:hypothetical protein
MREGGRTSRREEVRVQRAVPKLQAPRSSNNRKYLSNPNTKGKCGILFFHPPDPPPSLLSYSSDFSSIHDHE